MSTFLEAFPKLFNEELEKASEHTSTIVNCLEYISVNSADGSQLAQDTDPNYIYSPNLTNEDIDREYNKYKMQNNMVSIKVSVANFVKLS